MDADSKTIGIITMGCPKNLVDSEKLALRLQYAGYKVAHEQSPADIIIVNTCAFIHDAREESVEMILDAARLKSEGRVAKLIVTGCLAERYKSELANEIPEVDGFFGVNEYDNLVKVLNGDAVAKDHKRLLGTPSHYAFLKIAEGCNHACAFCAIPSIRGAFRSEPIEQLVDEANWLASTGVKELIVIAQDTTSFGVDIYKQRRLAELLERLCEIQKLHWIRLMYTYPAGFPESVIPVIRDHPKMAKYLDIPLQHISDRVLLSMERGIDGNGSRRLIEKIRNSIPDITIRTSFIVGYPGESRAEFSELKKFVSDFSFDRMGVFAYSHEEGTPAALLKDDISHETKLRRLDALRSLHEKQSLTKNLKRIGSQIQIIVDGDLEGIKMGRTQADAPEVDQVVILSQASVCKPGDIVQVNISDASSFELFGEVAD